MDVQNSCIENFKTEDEIDLFNQNFEITENDDDRVNLIVFKNF
jgi:hypothetical protein